MIPFQLLLDNDLPGPEAAVGGKVEIEGSDVIFTLEPDFTGTAGFVYTLADSGTPVLTAQAAVSFAVEKSAGQPIATGTTTAIRSPRTAW